MMKNRYCVIMAGGVGSRFWPKSTESSPKQFLDVLGTGETLIQQTFSRFRNLVPTENILVVTNDRYVDLVREQLPQIHSDNILAEPCMRNTAPCLAYAIKKIQVKNPNAVMVVAPADHLITKQDVFEQVMNLGLDYVGQHPQILTIGIQPHRPNTGYGYIEYQKTENQPEFQPVSVRSFKEKPDVETAKKYIQLGNYSWNSGMFLLSIPTILESFEKLAPEVISHFHTEESVYYTSNEREFIEEVYENCPNISIDYAILEKANNVSVINTDIGWSDIGTWVSLQEHISPTEEGNFVISGTILSEDSTQNIISMAKGKKLILKGVDEMIVVEREDVLMIVAKKYEQDIKELRAQAGEMFGKEIM